MVLNDAQRNGFERDEDTRKWVGEKKRGSFNAYGVEKSQSIEEIYDERMVTYVRAWSFRLGSRNCGEITL